MLICQTDGRPVDPRNLEKSFKEHQKRIGIPENERIDFQGLRKSGQMHKVRLSQNNYQLVAENAGQSPEVLMNHYNEALDYREARPCHGCGEQLLIRIGKHLARRRTARMCLR